MKTKQTNDTLIDFYKYRVEALMKEIDFLQAQIEVSKSCQKEEKDYTNERYSKEHQIIF